MSTSPAAVTLQNQRFGFPTLNFPSINPQPVAFNQALQFNSPQLSARMADTIAKSRLRDFKVLQKVTKKPSQSLTSRNAAGIKARTQQPSIIDAEKLPRRHLNSFDHGQMNELLNTGRSSLKNSTAVQQANAAGIKTAALRGISLQEGSTMMQSTARDTQTNQFISTERQTGGFQHISTTQTNHVAIRHNELYDSVAETSTFMQDAMAQVRSGQHKNSGYQTFQIATGSRVSPRHVKSVSTAGSIKTANNRASVEDHRPSIMSESMTGSNLMATRIPHRQSLADQTLNLMKTQEEFQFRRRDEVSAYSVGHNTPMSPGARQRFALDKIQQMTLKARGKLLPGQPTPKQYAEQMRRERTLICPQEYGDTSPFVHNKTAKPITAYRFDKFKEYQQLRGVKLDKDIPDKELAEYMKKRRSDARFQNSLYKNQPGKRKTISFRDQNVELYTEEDKARLAKGLRPQMTRRTTHQSQITTETAIDSDTDATTSADKSRLSMMSITDQKALVSQLNDRLANSNMNNIHQRPKKYDLYGDSKNKKDFVKDLEQKIKDSPPDINISEIVDQFYNRNSQNGMPVESYKLVFQKVLEREKKSLLMATDKPVEKTAEKPVFHLTRDPTLAGVRRFSQMRRIVEDAERDYSPPSRFFTLHKYTLRHLQEAYKAYKQARQGIVYAAREVKRYNKMKEGEVVRISEQEIVAEIRQNPQLEKVARIIENPLTYALIRMLITYEKYNYETEEQGIGMSFNRADDMVLQDETTFSQEGAKSPPFKEIELMKELVLEFGEAINERIKEDSGPTPRELHQNPPKEQDLETLSGHPLRMLTRRNSYYTINRYIAEHPEFEQIKDEAKKKVLDRVQKYQESQKSQSVAETTPFSPGETSPAGLSGFDSPSFVPENRSRLGSTTKNFTTEEPASPLYLKQKSIFEPKRKSMPKKQKLTLQQFVQSNHFQGAFQELIQTLDTHYKSRRDQNKQAAQHINKQVFYQLAKESVSFNAADNPNIEYLNDCYDQKVMPFPIFSKIRGNVLSLVGYHLNDGYAVAMQNYLSHQRTEEALIEKLILHANSCSDQSFAAILQGLLKNCKLRHLHYSLNDLGMKSNQALLKLLQIPFPNQLKSLCLSNLKTTGKASTSDLKMNEAEAVEPATEDGQVIAVQESAITNKPNIVHQLTINLLQTDSLLKLVLQDMVLGERAQRNIVLFVEKNAKLENLQLINCQMQPESLAMICEELETQQSLLNLSFRKNVMSKNKLKQTQAFVDALAQLITAAPAMMHLDISGMFIGEKGIEKIIKDGVAHSKTLAAIHFSDNVISHWVRLRIYSTLTKAQIPQKNEQQADSRELMTKMDSIQSFAFDEDEAQAARAAAMDEDSDPNAMEAKGMDILINRKRGSALLDEKLDKDKIEEELLMSNINEMVKASMPIINFTESQMIIDEEHLKEQQSVSKSGAAHEGLKGGIAEDLRGTLYNRVSYNPALYADKVERDKYYEGSRWLSIDYHTGCWICNSAQIIERVSKRNTTLQQKPRQRHKLPTGMSKSFSTPKRI